MARGGHGVREVADVGDDDLLDVEEVGDRHEVEDEEHQEHHVQRTFPKRQRIGHRQTIA
jgi:hypothetical protein